MSESGRAEGVEMGWDDGREVNKIVGGKGKGEKWNVVWGEW